MIILLVFTMFAHLTLDKGYAPLRCVALLHFGMGSSILTF